MSGQAGKKCARYGQADRRPVLQILFEY